MWLPWGSVVLLIGLGAVPLRAQKRSAEPNEVIIDAHWHTSLGPGDPRAPAAVARRREAIRVMDSLGVRHVVVIGTPDLLSVWRHELGSRAIPALLFPCEGGKAVNFGRECFPGGADFPDTAWLRSEITAGRVRAVGEITAQYIGMAPNDSRLEPYYALAEELDVPVLIHLGFGPPAAPYPSSPVPRKSPSFRAAAGSPLLLEDVLLRHKRLRVLVMHAGWPLIDEMIAILYYHPQVYVDLAGLQSSLVPRAAYDASLRKLVEAGFSDRIVFGSDGTENGVDWLQNGVDAVLKSSLLSASQRRSILYKNAARFFGLDSLPAPR